ncbi:hypothetical protein BH09SUM1_BH09SUM1_13220 [soil metagenome]
MLTFNRDELPAKASEIPPVMRQPELGDVAILSPLDAPRRGTWIGVNSVGVAACLLNGYHENDIARRGAETAAASRGEIIPKMLAHGGFDECIAWVQRGFDPSLFKSFTLLVFSLQQGASIQWTGARPMKIEPVEGDWLMWTSSSWSAEEVLPWRRAFFEEWIRKGAKFEGDVPLMHLAQPEGMAEFTPLMCRDGGKTRSITQIQMTAAGQIEMRYWPDPVTALPLPRSRVKMAVSTPR